MTVDTAAEKIGVSAKKALGWESGSASGLSCFYLALPDEFRLFHHIPILAIFLFFSLKTLGESFT
jgi:hypothetical protein